jgi:5,10-methylenetetrahydromethanopterin reductase
VAVPFRVGVMQLTMEPLDTMLASARAMDEAGMDTIWLAEAYPWWRKHGMEARSSTVVSALIARATERLTVGWGIISPFTRHPVQVAMDARVVQEAAGPDRFILGFGTSKIFLNNTKQGGPPKETKPLAHMRDSVEIMRGALSGKRFEYDGKVFSADLPALSPEAEAPSWDVPVYVAATAPLMQQLGGEIGDGLLTPSITTPAFVEYTRGNVRAGAARRAATRRRSTSAARSWRRSTPTTATAAATARARSRPCTSPTSSRTSAARPTRCSSWPGSRWRSSRRWPRRWSGEDGSPRRSR